MTAKPFGHCACRACPEKRIQNDISPPGCRQYDTCQQIFRLLGRVRFLSLISFQTFTACANRHKPVRTHLNAVIQRFHRFVIKRVFCRLRMSCPDQSLMSVGKAAAPEIWHRIGFTPDNVIQHPESDILNLFPNPENIMITANDP